MAERSATSPPMTSSPRWAASSPRATRPRAASSTPARPSAVDPLTVEFTLVSAERQLPVPRLGVQRPDRHHAGGLRDGHDARRDARRHRRLEARDLRRRRPARASSRNDAWWGGATPLDAVEYIFFAETGPMVTAYQGGQIDAHRPVRRLLRRPRCSTTRTSRSTRPRRPTIARSGCAPTPASSPTSASARRSPCRSTARRMVQQLFQGRGEVANDHVIFPHLPVLRLRRSRSGRATSRRPRRCSRPSRCHRPDRRRCTSPSSRRSRTSRPSSRARPPRPGSPSRRRSRASTRSTAPSGARPSRPTRPAPARPSSASSTTATARRPTCSSTRRSRRAACGTRRSTRRQTSTRPSPSSRRRSASMPRRRPAGRSRRSSTRTSPIGVPYTYSFLSGNAKTFTGVYSSALGQMFVSSRLEGRLTQQLTQTSDDNLGATPRVAPIHIGRSMRGRDP